MPINASIFRLIVPVGDLAAGVEFYQTLLADDGLDVHGGRHYFDCGGVILALLETDSAPIADYIYFSVTDLETFHEHATGLNCLEQRDVHGAPAGDITVRPWRERSFYVRDPFGNGLCFVDSETLFTGARR